jgi:hypothetical protein
VQITCDRRSLLAVYSRLAGSTIIKKARCPPGWALITLPSLNLPLRGSTPVDRCGCLTCGRPCTCCAIACPSCLIGLLFVSTGRRSVPIVLPRPHPFSYEHADCSPLFLVLFTVPIFPRLCLLLRQARGGIVKVSTVKMSSQPTPSTYALPLLILVRKALPTIRQSLVMPSLEASGARIRRNTSSPMRATLRLRTFLSRITKVGTIFASKQLRLRGLKARKNYSI